MTFFSLLQVVPEGPERTNSDEDVRGVPEKPNTKTPPPKKTQQQPPFPPTTPQQSSFKALTPPPANHPPPHQPPPPPKPPPHQNTPTTPQTLSPPPPPPPQPLIPRHRSVCCLAVFSSLYCPSRNYPREKWKLFFFILKNSLFSYSQGGKSFSTHPPPLSPVCAAPKT